MVAIGLLWYVLSDVPIAELTGQFRRANLFWLLLTVFVIGSYYVIRAIRWQLTLQALHYQPSLVRTTIALLTGTVASLLVPGAGELTRCVTLQRTDGIPIAQGIGSVVAERIIDLFMLVLVLLLTVLLEFDRMRSYTANLTLTVPNTYLIAGVVGAGVVGWLVIRWALRTQVVRAHPLIKKALGVSQGFGRGFQSIRQLPQPGLFVLLTVLGQVFAWLSVYLLLLAVDATRSLPPTAALTILAVSSLGGLAVPTQGGIGTYHFLVSRALVLYGFTATEGAITATFLHAVGFGINLTLSGISFLLLPVLIAAKQTQPAKNAVK